jgi:3D (Asp-Asp-Asp) domain-containing protein
MRLFAIAVLVSLTAAVAHAGTTKIPDANVEVWYPDKWNISKDQTTVTITDPADEAALMFLTIPGEKLDEALNALDAQIAKIATDVAVTGKPSEQTINGMKVVVVDAKGKVKGKKVDISAALVLRPNKKLMLMFGMVESSKLKKHEADLVKVVGSLKPAR